MTWRGKLLIISGLGMLGFVAGGAFMLMAVLGHAFATPESMAAINIGFMVVMASFVIAVASAIGAFVVGWRQTPKRITLPSVFLGLCALLFLSNFAFVSPV